MPLYLKSLLRFLKKKDENTKSHEIFSVEYKMVNIHKRHKHLKFAKETVMTNPFEGSVLSNDTLWDPHLDNDAVPLSTVAANRIKRDLMSLFTDPPPGIFVVPDETDLRISHILVIGPSDTPYDGGLFYFFLKCPTNYPMQPPKIKLMTTDGGKVRFNPNFYKCGKLCVSILGTWAGPSWTPITNLSSLLVTIQSLMVENPLLNEPNIMNVAPLHHLDFDLYNEYITHETLRVAVCGMVENECSLNMPKQFKSIIEQSFINYYDQYIETANKYMHKNGITIKVPYFCNKHTFHFDKILERLQKNYEKLTTKS